METKDFTEIFTRIKTQLLPYGKRMDVRVDKEGNYQLYIVKDIELAGRKFSECYFSGTVIKNTMVSFYFFPVYTHPAAFVVPDAIKKNMKGKSCFNFKKLDDVQEKAIAALLKDGAAFYKKIKLL
jgi:hypothetical protein